MREKLQGFEEALLEVRKVTKVTTGWRRMRFRAMVLVGDRAWHIGLGIGKGNDVAIAVGKATHDAYKNVRDVSITKTGSVPYMITNKYKACFVTLRPAGPGTWLKAWSSVRTVLELSGYSNILSKIIGSNNPLNNAIATINALTSFKVNSDNVQTVSEVVKEVEEKKDSKKSDRKTDKKPTHKPVMKKEASTDKKEPVAKKEAVKPTVKKATPKKISQEDKTE